MTTLFVGNLPFTASDADLRARFAAFGNVIGARVALDRETRRPRGFGFVEMSNSEEADAASKALSGSEFQGRILVVNPARPKTAAHARDRRA